MHRLFPDFHAWCGVSDPPGRDRQRMTSFSMYMSGSDLQGTFGVPFARLSGATRSRLKAYTRKVLGADLKPAMCAPCSRAALIPCA